MPVVDNNYLNSQTSASRKRKGYKWGLIAALILGVLAVLVGIGFYMMSLQPTTYSDGKGHTVKLRFFPFSKLTPAANLNAYGSDSSEKRIIPSVNYLVAPAQNGSKLQLALALSPLDHDVTLNQQTEPVICGKLTMIHSASGADIPLCTWVIGGRDFMKIFKINLGGVNYLGYIIDEYPVPKNQSDVDALSAQINLASSEKDIESIIASIQTD